VARTPHIFHIFTSHSCVHTGALYVSIVAFCWLPCLKPITSPTGQSRQSTVVANGLTLLLVVAHCPRAEGPFLAHRKDLLSSSSSRKPRFCSRPRNAQPLAFANGRGPGDMKVTQVVQYRTDNVFLLTGHFLDASRPQKKRVSKFMGPQTTKKRRQARYFG
jgi:hypothetical protein